MTKKEMKRNIVGPNEINGIRQKCSENLEAQVCAPISQSMEHLKKFAFHNALLPNVPAITISVDTFFTLMEPSSENFQVSSRWKGFETGEKFAKKYIDFLRSEVGVPQSLFYLLKGWTIFDTGANWGTFEIRNYEENNQLIVTVENSFLTRTHLTNKHRHCEFMTGYIEGVLWTCMNFYPRWFSQIVPQNIIPRVKPVTIEEKPEGDICRFIITLKKEELTKEFDQLYEIGQLVESDDLRRIPLEIRTVIETALKKKLGIPDKERIYVPQLIIPFKDAKESPRRFKSLIKKIPDIYAWASRDAHISLQYSKEEILDAIKIVANFLRELELMEINNIEQDVLRKKAFDAKTGKIGRGIFISYSHNDESFVKKLIKDLEGSGIQVWVDEKKIGCGDIILKKIQEGIVEMVYFGAILSPNYINSEYCMKELEMALTLELEHKKVKVLPLWYQECDMPLFLKDKKYADFRDDSRYEIALEIILKKIRE